MKSLDKTVFRCWKNLRDRYIMEFKKTKKPTGTGGLPYIPKWDLFEINVVST